MGLLRFARNDEGFDGGFRELNGIASASSKPRNDGVAAMTANSRYYANFIAGVC